MAEPKQLSVSTLAPETEVTLDDIAALGEHAAEIMDRIRSQIYRPDQVKVPPRFSLPQLAALCGLSDDAMLRRMEKAEERGLPLGTAALARGGARPRRDFSVAEAEAWVAGQLEWSSRRLTSASVAPEFGALVAAAAFPIDDHRSTADYRRHAIGVCAQRALERCFT